MAAVAAEEIAAPRSDAARDPARLPIVVGYKAGWRYEESGWRRWQSEAWRSRGDMRCREQLSGEG